MKKLEFKKEIKAPAQKVWSVLWNDDTYSKWTASFNPKGESLIKSDWKVNGKTLFVDTEGNGMVSTIRILNAPYDVVFEHLGEVKDGVEDTTSERVKGFAGSLEEYHLSENNGVTNLVAITQTHEDWEKMLTDGFTTGLDVVKEISEN